MDQEEKIKERKISKYGIFIRIKINFINSFNKFKNKDDVEQTANHREKAKKVKK